MQSASNAGTHKIYVKTWGCAHNSSDSEYMAGQLAAKGYSIVGELQPTANIRSLAKHFLPLDGSRVGGPSVVVGIC